MLLVALIGFPSCRIADGLDLHMSRQPRQGSLAGTSASETRHLMSAGLSVRL